MNKLELKWEPYVPRGLVSCQCVICGNDYDEAPWCLRDDLLMICSDCLYPKGTFPIRLRNTGLSWWDAIMLPEPSAVIVKQTEGLAAAIYALEQEVRCGS